MIAGLFVLLWYYSFYLWYLFIPIFSTLLFFGGRYWWASNSWLIKAGLGVLLLMSLIILLISLDTALDRMSYYFSIDRIRFRLRFLRTDIFIFFLKHDFLSYVLLPLGLSFLFAACSFWQVTPSLQTQLIAAALMLVGLVIMAFGGYSLNLYFYRAFLVLPWVGLFSFFLAFRYWHGLSQLYIQFFAIPLALFGVASIILGIYSAYLNFFR